MARQRLETEHRRELILAAALALSGVYGYNKITREQVATAACCADNLISHHFGTMPNFRRDIMREAIRRGNLVVLAQGLAARDPHAQKAPTELKEQALRGLMQ